MTASTTFLGFRAARLAWLSGRRTYCLITLLTASVVYAKFLVISKVLYPAVTTPSHPTRVATAGSKKWVHPRRRSMANHSVSARR